MTDPWRLEDIEAIRQLKHRYFRLLDTKGFDELGTLLTPDATSSYQSGELSQQGRAAIVAFLKESLSGPGIVTMHTGHHPEIFLSTDSSASGTWYLEDIVIVPDADLEIHGTALYRDEYTKLGQEWKISHTGYDRIFERHRKLSSGATTSLQTRFG
jgi:SnoaL-like domain